jgi:hypothetical protein
MNPPAALKFGTQGGEVASSREAVGARRTHEFSVADDVGTRPNELSGCSSSAAAARRGTPPEPVRDRDLARSINSTAGDLGGEPQRGRRALLRRASRRAGARASRGRAGAVAVVPKSRRLPRRRRRPAPPRRSIDGTLPPLAAQKGSAASPQPPGELPPIR